MLGLVVDNLLLQMLYLSLLLATFSVVLLKTVELLVEGFQGTMKCLSLDEKRCVLILEAGRIFLQGCYF